MTTESQKKARNKWDAQNMVVLGCKVRREQADLFRGRCKEAGTSVNEVFRLAMERFLAETEGGDTDTVERG